MKMQRGVWIGVWVLVGALLLLWGMQFYGGITGRVIDMGSGDCIVGEMGVIVEDGPPGISYYIESGGERYELIVEGEAERLVAELISGMEVTACGVVGRETLELGDLRIEEGKGRSEPIQDVTGEQRVAFMLVNFIDDTSEPYTVSEVEDLMDEVDQYYREISYGQTWLNTSVFGYFTLQTSSSSCIPSMWQARVLENWGIDPLPYPAYIQNWHEYDRLIIALNKDACSWTGSGTVGKKTEQSVHGPVVLSTIWLDGPPSDGRSGISGVTLTTISHELGHNHGVRHSGDFECGDIPYGDGYSYPCYSVEYGDAYSVMGRSYEAASLHMDVVHKEMIGWLDEYDLDVVDRSNLGVHGMGPIHVDSPYGVGIKIPRVDRFGDDDGYYYLEYRQPLGVDAGVNASLFEGIFVRIDRWASGSGGGADAHLLDMSPHPDYEINQLNDSHDPILKIGGMYQTFNDDYVIYPLQLNENFASVLVSTIPCYDTDSSGEYPGGRNYHEGGRLFDGMKLGKDECKFVYLPDPNPSQLYGVEAGESPMLAPPSVQGFGAPQGVPDTNDVPSIQRAELMDVYLEEYYCENGVWHKELKDCKDLGAEYECINAACVVPGVCNDSDGGLNYFEAGTMSYEGKIGRDQCRLDGFLGEYYCNGNQGGYEIKDCSDFGADYLCSEGICNDCTDSDGGLNFEVRGIVSKGGFDYEDYCLDSDFVLEYYCDGLYVGNVTYDCRDLALDCWQGKCTTPE